MYCPKCSQQQVSDEMRFCSRCGFPLGSVRELVASGGGALTEPAKEVPVSQLSRSFKGVRKGVWLMLASLPLVLVVGLLSGINDVFAVFLLLPVLCFLAGFARLLYATFIEERRARSKRDASQPHPSSVMPAQLATGAQSPELPPARVAPIEEFTARRMETAEMTQPPSVTENTTRLLDEAADSQRR